MPWYSGSRCCSRRRCFLPPRGTGAASCATLLPLDELEEEIDEPAPPEESSSRLAAGQAPPAERHRRGASRHDPGPVRDAAPSGESPGAAAPGGTAACATGRGNQALAREYVATRRRTSSRVTEGRAAMTTPDTTV